MTGVRVSDKPLIPSLQRQVLQYIHRDAATGAIHRDAATGEMNLPVAQVEAWPFRQTLPSLHLRDSDSPPLPHFGCRWDGDQHHYRFGDVVDDAILVGNCSSVGPVDYHFGHL